MFYPSKVENHIYEIIEDLFTGDLETYSEKAYDLVEQYLISTGIEFKIICSNWRDMAGYDASFAWVEDGHLHLIGFSVERDAN